jgi:hypothetical protein
MVKKLLLLAVVVAVLGPTSDAQQKAGKSTRKAPLGRKLTAALNRVESAYHQGDSFRVWQALGPAVGRLKEKQLQTLDTALAERKLPSVGELLVDARVKLVQQNLNSALPAPKPRERVITVVALYDQVDKFLQETEQDPAVTGAGQPPGTFDEYKELLWQFHVLRNGLLKAERSVQFAGKLAAGIRGRSRKRLSEHERESVDEGGRTARARIEQIDRKLEALEMETRFARLTHGVQVLEKSELTREKFFAAYLTGEDARALGTYLARQGQGAAPVTAQPQPSKATPASAAATGSNQTSAASPAVQSAAATPSVLKSPGIINEVAEKRKLAERLAGDLGVKARMFFEGLHWWITGRYGSGPDLGGLAKSEAALKSPQALLWLYMPKKVPEPTDPAKISVRMPATHIDRRHHYTWAWEDRRLQWSSWAGPSSSEATETSSRYGTLSRFW